MTIDDKNILWLDLFECLSYTKKIKMLESVPRGQDIRKTFLTNPIIKEILSQEEFNKLALCLSDQYLNLRLESYEKENIITITHFDSRYPYLLREIDSPPLCLYCKGNIQLLDSLCVGIVGTRKPTDYGVVVTKQFAKALAKEDITIVSGLAIGVDTIAHKTALEEEGKTIAVLAGGFHHIYPAINHKLANQMLVNNLLITENNPDTIPHAYLFPSRNRIIAGLSKGVLVTEASEHSGTLHTVNYAIEYNREIFVVPGKINSEASRGCNKLIKQYVGSITLSPDDIFQAFHINTEKNPKNIGVQLDINVQLVLDYIMTEKKTFQQILEHTHMSAKDLNTILIELEMSGTITKLANNSYIMS